MEDPYWRYGASADRGSISRSSFPGYLSSEPSALTSHHLSLTPHPGAYGLDDITGNGMGAEPGLSGLTAGASIRGYPPLQDPVLLGQRPDLAVGIGSGIPDLINGRPGSLARVDGIPVPARESNILFVDGLPSDSSRREVGHLFRPFIGFKDIRVVHKEPRRSGDKAMVLCFVEFDDAKCALTALEALQGYKFDDKKSDSPVLKIHFAHFPFRLPSDHGEQWSGGP
ncbi:RNA-binding protein 2-like isoform X2 [Rhododendron vialii]|uniref:RNA-binding protein 2-like isoform X2 n=1 Tax=Rhododendron vialii TaxID=182163 RepID=UPI00265DA81D|nr:RNA-binding protein 2-like isoform X2 [Rhododendron vialii]